MAEGGREIEEYITKRGASSVWNWFGWLYIEKQISLSLE